MHWWEIPIYIIFLLSLLFLVAIVSASDREAVMNATATINISAYDLAQTIGVLAIMRDLAAMHPFNLSGVCKFCGHYQAHTTYCVWKRAKDIEESGVLNDRSNRRATEGDDHLPPA